MCCHGYTCKFYSYNIQCYVMLGDLDVCMQGGLGCPVFHYNVLFVTNSFPTIIRTTCIYVYTLPE